MRQLMILTALLSCVYNLKAQDTHHLFYGMYLQWGYNGECYSHSNIHFKMSNGDDFILHHAKAHDQADYEGIYKHPEQVSIPQYNYRFGFYLNKDLTKAIEI